MSIVILIRIIAYDNSRDICLIILGNISQVGPAGLEGSTVSSTGVREVTIL